MPIVYRQLNFLGSVNVSCQVGATGDTSDLIQLGPVLGVTTTSVSVSFDDSTVLAPEAGDYVLFAKNKMINTSSLLGYYAEAKFINNSNKKIELFSVSSEVIESSK